MSLLGLAVNGDKLRPYVIIYIYWHDLFSILS